MQNADFHFTTILILKNGITKANMHKYSAILQLVLNDILVVISIIFLMFITYTH